MRGPQPLKEALLPRELDGADTQTHRQTHGHGDLLTNSAQWGRDGENAFQRQPRIQKELQLRHETNKNNN